MSNTRTPANGKVGEVVLVADELLKVETDALEVLLGGLRCRVSNDRRRREFIASIARDDNHEGRTEAGLYTSAGCPLHDLVMGPGLDWAGSGFSAVRPCSVETVCMTADQSPLLSESDITKGNQIQSKRIVKSSIRGECI